jgi:hypothetical protein
VQPDEAVSCGAQAGLRIGRGKPGRRGSSDPLVKNETPLGTPPFSHRPQVPLPCIDPCVFAVVFDDSLREPRPGHPTANERLGVKASDEQRVDKLQVTGATTRPPDCQRETGRQSQRRAAGRQIARCHSAGAVPNRGWTTVATAQARGSTNAADASIQNDSGPPQGPATGPVVG